SPNSKRTVVRDDVIPTLVAPAEAGVQAYARMARRVFAWTPAYAGTTRCDCWRFFAPIVVSVTFPPDRSASRRECGVRASVSPVVIGRGDRLEVHGNDVRNGDQRLRIVRVVRTQRMEDFLILLRGRHRLASQ